MDLHDPDPIHGWFELSYAQYLTIPRTALQSMPVEWQRRFVACLEELDDAIDWRPGRGRYWVTLQPDADSDDFEPPEGAYDRLADYERGRRRIPVKPAEPCEHVSPEGIVEEICMWPACKCPCAQCQRAYGI